MKNKQIIITVFLLIMLILIGVNTVLADGLTPMGTPVGKKVMSQTVLAIVTGPPIGFPALSAGEELANSSHISEPQSQAFTQLATPTNP